MPILRAGPFASSTDSFLDEPIPATTAAPVNCASDDTSANWEWRFGFGTRSDGDPREWNYLDGFPDVSESDPTVGTFSGLSSWYYQATSPFSLTFTYEVIADTTTGGFQSATFSIRTKDGNIFFDIDSGFGITATVSGSTTLEFPASVVPTIILINADTDAKAGGSFSYSVSPA